MSKIAKWLACGKYTDISTIYSLVAYDVNVFVLVLRIVTDLGQSSNEIKMLSMAVWKRYGCFFLCVRGVLEFDCVRSHVHVYLCSSVLYKHIKWMNAFHTNNCHLLWRLWTRIGWFAFGLDLRCSGMTVLFYRHFEFYWRSNIPMSRSRLRVAYQIVSK